MSASTDAHLGDAAETDIRPVVGQPSSNRELWLFAAAVMIVAVLLFSALEGRRTVSQSRSVLTPDDEANTVLAAPPPLAIPADIQNAASYTDPAIPQAPRLLDRQPFLATQTSLPPPRVPRVGTPQSTTPAPAYDPPPPFVPAFRPPPISPTITPTLPQQPGTQGDRLAGTRVAATRLANPGSTVPQGTVIQAVLETALDSNRPGFARAVVSRDVRSFDGQTILIPRGSRLFGEYKADLADGQNRVFVNWQKLTRPDGAQIGIESPAADPLGRAGVKGDVNTHFFQRFGGAVLQSALDLGVAVASRRASGNNSIVVGLPGSTSQVIQTTPRQVRPTLTVRQGSRVSVFVARDLDFAPVQ